MTFTKTALYTTIAAICLPIGVFVYSKINGGKRIEFEQEIRPLKITVDNIRNGYRDRPYMPFRYPLNQTMALVKMDINYWGIIDFEYFKFMEVKRKIFNNYDVKELEKNRFFKRLYDNESNKVFEELCDFVVKHYLNRYPRLFSKKGNVIYNHLLEEEYNLEEMDPFIVITRIAMEDFYVVQNSKCIGVSVAFGGGGFPISPIVGESLDKIHKPVPYYETKLKKSMNKWFDKFTDPVERSSWHVVWDKDLTCSELYSKYRELSDEEYKEYILSLPIKDFEVRVERQSLIKLPKTEAIIFSNHPIYLNIVDDIVPEPYAASIVLKSMYESPQDIIKYKHFEAIRDHISPMIEKLNRYPSEKPRTLASYPFAHWMEGCQWTVSHGFVHTTV